MGGKLDKDHVHVQCLPLYSILLSLNRTTIDYFSLDVEGNELDVLKTIPWDKVNITVSKLLITDPSKPRGSLYI
ncbi:UNVERIFIED_CONTAM: hypothetical protein GTU68_058802 [Idotea baltica]|nr:hypothetical protein [Idotea baltica]